jgi:GT2 family glycosyltransferase
MTSDTGGPVTSDNGLVVLVVAYGSPDALATCLHALEGRYPVTVIDNSSSYEVHEVAKNAAARYLDPGANLGFASGVNLGLEHVVAPGVDVLLLNPDAIVAPGVVEQLHRDLRISPRLACVAPAQHAPDSSTPDRVCWPFPTPGKAWLEAIGLGRFERSCDYLIGSVLLVRGAALIDVGGFDERFFMYAEETDWQHRATLRGWEMRLSPDAVAIHVGAGTDDDEARRVMRFHTGVERYVRKWHGAGGWLSYRVATILGALLRAFILTGSRRRAAAERVRLYLRGPDATARRAGAVPPPRARVPAFSREPPG